MYGKYWFIGDYVENWNRYLDLRVNYDVWGKV